MNQCKHQYCLGQGNTDQYIIHNDHPLYFLHYLNIFHLLNHMLMSFHYIHNLFFISISICLLNGKKESKKKEKRKKRRKKEREKERRE